MDWASLLLLVYLAITTPFTLFGVAAVYTLVFAFVSAREVRDDRRDQDDDDN